LATASPASAKTPLNIALSLHEVRFRRQRASVVGIGPGSLDQYGFEGETGTAYYTVSHRRLGHTLLRLADGTLQQSGRRISCTVHAIAELSPSPATSVSDTDVTHPLTINGYSVTAISEYAFYNQSQLTSMTFSPASPDWRWAFAGCSNLTSIAVET